MKELTETELSQRERMWRQTLPGDYRSYLLITNGGIPQKRCFLYNEHEYLIVRFLGILENSDVDIDVVLSQIEDRLTDNEDLVGCELLPIAELYAGDYVCIDFRGDPNICVWSHEESQELDPVTYPIADSFSKFLDMLY